MNDANMLKNFILLTVIILNPVAALCQEETSQEPEEEDFGLWNYKKLLLDENGKWSVGAGALVRNSPFRGEKISVFPFPLVDYSSKNLFIREFKAGYHLKGIDDPYKGGIFFDTYLGARMRPGDARKKFSIDAGLRTGYQHPLGSVSLSFTQDMTGASDGKEASVAYSFTFQSKSKKTLVIPRITLTWQDRKMANYLWGISEETTAKMIKNNEAVILDPYTFDKSVINYSAGIIHIYKLDKNWSSILGAQLAVLDPIILDNPAIERQFDYSFIVGAAYTF